MKQTIYVAVAALGVTVSSSSAMNSMDADGNGLLSFTEMLAAMPLLTVAKYRTIDANADGNVDSDELATARTAGLVPSGS